MKLQKKSEKQAVALTYSPEMNAPVVSAKGQGFVADKIIEKARESGIDTYVDEELLSSLMTISLGEEIPQELYEIVAKVLVFVEKLDQGARK